MTTFGRSSGRAGDRASTPSNGFLAALAGVADPEQKRKIIGGLFVEVFEEQAQQAQPVLNGWPRAPSTRT
jgi:GMP synthase (glutamine-hydrolysing)